MVDREVGHLCYMAPLLDVVAPSDKTLFVFYDFEACQNKKFTSTATEHVPNLVCVQQFCSMCENVENINQDCRRCGPRKHTFWEEDPVGDFISYLCMRRPWAKKIVVIAHNAKAYDLHFILNRAVLLKWDPELIMNGLKIMGMRFQHLVFLDSCLFMPLPLRKLSDAFGLKARKQFYCHYFNRLENLDYIGPMPDISYYGVDEMSEAERTEFLAWYQDQSNALFDNRRVLEEYCQADVSVLRQASQIFRRELMQVGNIDPFLESYTIASACNRVFRKRFLKPDTIGLIPAGGYTEGHAFSKKALMWITYVERTQKCKITHGRMGREFRLPQLPHLRVDGFSHETNTVYEFFGCYWHGCPCRPYRDVKTIAGVTLAERYEQTMTRLEKITQAGYQVEIMWECRFDREILPRHPELQKLSVFQQVPLRTRDALYGGRTEAMRLHYKVREGEVIRYVDVMSLYPYICKYGKFPKKHPIIHVGDSCKDIQTMLKKEGLIKCSILPPRQLYHPVLPYRCNQKLLFCLCRTCADEMNTDRVCTHSEAERVLEGTWILDEVRLAVLKGYRVIQVHELYEYEVTQYNRQTGEGGLFVEYVNTFLKLKAEASGYPAWVVTSLDKEKYVADFQVNEGILLDAEAIKPNAAKRALAKLCLNSMWGKLTERNNRTKTAMISDPHELYRFLVTPGIEVPSIIFASDVACWVSWRYSEEEQIPNLPHTNEVIGAYVTAGARIHLYKYLDLLQRKCLYCDTDSLIYYQADDEPPLITCGDRLGDMTDELKSDEFIDEFLGGGPKNYAYRIVTRDGSRTPHTVCKIRGVTLNYSSLQSVNFDVIRAMILKDQPTTVVVHTARKMKRKKRTDGGGACVTIVTEPEAKIYRISFLKRRRLDDNDSLPLGYK